MATAVSQPVTLISGSLKPNSSNHALLQRLETKLNPHFETCIFEGLKNLPHFVPNDLALASLDSVCEWKKQIAKSKCVVFSCPEYGHSMPGVVKNGVDWLIGSGEFVDREVFLTSAIAHPSRGMRGIAALKQTLQAASANVVWDSGIVDFCDSDLDKIISLIKKS